jgi:hypothetical protein
MSELLRVFRSEDRPNVILIPYAFEFLWNTLHICNIHRTQRLNLFAQKTVDFRVNKLINENLGDNRLAEDRF